MKLCFPFLPEDLSVAEEPGIYDEGSPVYIEARVQTTSGMLFPKIFVDECYGTDTKEQIHPRRLYMIADNHGSVVFGCAKGVRWPGVIFSLFILTSSPFIV